MTAQLLAITACIAGQAVNIALAWWAMLTREEGDLDDGR